MRYQVRYDPKAKKQLEKLSSKDILRINEAINRLTFNPFMGKKLKGELSSYYVIRVWPYRVVYETYHSILLILVVQIAHRKDVYR